jgi:hypothetical protein
VCAAHNARALCTPIPLTRPACPTARYSPPRNIIRNYRLRRLGPMYMGHSMQKCGRRRVWACVGVGPHAVLFTSLFGFDASRIQFGSRYDSPLCSGEGRKGRRKSKKPDPIHTIPFIFFQRQKGVQKLCRILGVYRSTALLCVQNGPFHRPFHLPRWSPCAR